VEGHKVAQKKAYSRYFIILQEEQTGYSLASDKLPSGYAKLETKHDKCKISYYVQDLKKEMAPYYIALICNKRDTKKLIKLGQLNIDDFGRAEVTFEYGTDNVAGSNIGIDMVIGAAIIKFVDSNVTSIMSGFSTTDVPTDWKTYPVFEFRAVEEVNKDQEVKPVVAEEKTAKEKQPQPVKAEVREESKNIFDEYEQKIEEAKTNSKQIAEIFASEDRDANDDVNAEAIKAGEETREGHHAEVFQNETSHNSEVEDSVKASGEERSECPLPEEADASCNIGEEYATKNQTRENKKEGNLDYPIGTLGEFFKLVAEEFEVVLDVCGDIKKCKWHKVKVKTLDDLCNATNYNKYTIAYYPMISYYPYIKKHEHYLLGYKYDNNGKMKYLVYGVPGTKSKSDQPYGGKSGFVTWVPEKVGEEKEESFGYWLMFYDFRTSTIVIPMK
jgi:hypothetical protein